MMAYKMRRHVQRLISLLMLLLPFSQAICADRYTFDALHSIPQFGFNHLGVTTQSGRFDKAEGNIVIDFVRHKGSVSYDVDTSSLNMGYGTETPESPGYRLFNVVQFPKIHFQSNKLIFNQDNLLVAAEGKLTLLGVTRALTVNVNNFRCGKNPMNKLDTCACEVSASLLRSEFGMTQYIPGISDEITITVPVEAYKTP